MPKGFTLIELLVTISIVGIISGIIINSTLAIQKSSRDAQRKSDLRVIQGTLQQYYADQNFFPTSSGTNSFNIVSSGSLKSSIGISPAPSGSPKVYLEKIPKDPTTDTTPYCYKAFTSLTTTPLDGTCDNVNTKCHGYYLCAKTENPDSEAKACPQEVACPAGYNFSLSPL